METKINPVLHRKIQWYLTLAGLSGIVSLFLPFSWDTSPWTALTDEFTVYLAAPAFLSLFISAALFRQRLSGSLARPVRLVLYGLSAASASLTLWVIFVEVGIPPTSLEWLSSIVPLAVMIAGAWMLIAGIRRKEADTTPLIAAMTAWLANTLMCLISFFPEMEGYPSFSWQAGAWLCLFTAVVYMTQICLFATKKKES